MHTMKTDFPAPGTFLRPVGHYAYCYELVKVSPSPHGTHWTFRRWGLRDGLPFDDGHIGTLFYHLDLVRCGRTAWKEPAHGCSNSFYLKSIESIRPPAQQLTFF